MSVRPGKKFDSAASRSVITLLAVLLVVSLFGGGLLYAGYQWGKQTGQQAAKAMQGEWQARLEQQQRNSVSNQSVTDESFIELARRLGELQSDVARLEAIGRRLMHQSGAGREEIDSKIPLGQGGPESVLNTRLSKEELRQSMQEIGKTIATSEAQFDRIDAYFLAKASIAVTSQGYPAGYPVANGWISSDYGIRTDPFTGQMGHHNGVDFAGKEGTPVVSAAGGTVTWSGLYKGYGQMVEIAHGNGYVTRYGHNKQLLVAVGQRVTKGQGLALMGSTGRSTGPHVHFEVLLNGKYMNPLGFLQSAR